jgi:hypothetical protein
MLYVGKFDLEGNLIWQKQFFKNKTYNDACGVAVLADGDILVSAMTDVDWVSTPNYPEKGNHSIIRLDSNGNVKWKRKLINDAKGYNHFFDGNGLINYKLANSDTFYKKSTFACVPRVIKFDSAANIIKQQYFLDTSKNDTWSGWNIKVLNPNRIIVVGEVSFNGWWRGTHSTAWVAMLDSNLNILWNNRYVREDSSSFDVLYDAAILPNGLIGCVGQSLY